MHIQESITGSARPTIPRSIVMPGLTILWLVVVAIFLQLKIGLGNVFALSPGELGGVIAGIVAPLALAGVILLLRERAVTPEFMARFGLDMPEPIKVRFIRMSQELAESLDYPSKLSRHPTHIGRLIADGEAQAGAFLDELVQRPESEAPEALVETVEVQGPTGPI